MLIYNLLNIPDKPIQSGNPPSQGLSFDEDISQSLFGLQSNFSRFFKYFDKKFPIFIIIEIIVQISCDKLPVKTILTFQFSHYLNICSFCPKLC